MHLQWEGMKLWCATYDGTILSRSLTNSKSSSFLSSSDWRHLDLDTSVITDNISPKAVNDIELTGYSDILYVRIKFILFRIDTKNGIFNSNML